MIPAVTLYDMVNVAVKLKLIPEAQEKIYCFEGHRLGIDI